MRALFENRESFVTLHGADAYNYRNSLELLAPTGLTLLQAVMLVADGARLLNGSADIPTAIKYYLENRPQKSPDITVREVVEQLLALKHKEGDVGQLYLRDLRVRLEKFAETFQCAICKVIPQQIRDYVLKTDNLHAWLLPHRKHSRKVCSFANLAIVYAHRAKRVECSGNAMVYDIPLAATGRSNEAKVL